MNHETRFDDSGSRELIDVLADEFSRRLSQGESPEIGEFVQRHPELADQIRDVFPALQILNQACGDGEPDPDETREMPAAPKRTKIGDYRIVRKIGQGGMGIVYEAQQESLGRRVALKVLPPHISGNKVFVERFRREARAAAKLHHTNIVPVYEVGQEGDTFFYAMQFIKGQPLDEVKKEVARLSQKDGTSESISKIISGSEISRTSAGASGTESYFKGIARLGASVADALGYAYERAIVHRDVKPSNLILDEDGVVWLADFGLAKTVDSELTGSGDFLGTIRYMAPERFKGRGDHRGDIYGLGVTLYEMATLKRAFDLDDRFEIMEQIASEDPPRPREIDRLIPLDLETIVIKAMDKDPRRRYQNAAELADDLRRFVDDQPIRARRASIGEQVLRWGRKNKALTAAIVSMAIAIAALTAGTLLVIDQRNRAESNEEAALAQKRRADESARQAEISAADARREAENARAAVREMLTAVGDERLRNVPMMDGLRTQLLEEALKFNRKFVAETNSVDDRREKAEAHYRIGEVYSLMEKHDEALFAFDDAKAVFASRLEAGDSAAGLRIAEIDLGVAKLLSEIDRSEESLDRVKLAMEYYENAIVEDELNPDLHAGYAESKQLVSLIRSRSGDFEEAELALEKALDSFGRLTRKQILEPQRYSALARTREYLANLYLDTGRMSESIAEFERALEIFVELAEEFPGERAYEEARAGTLGQIGRAYLNSGNPAAARAAFEPAVVALKDLSARYPQIGDYRSDAADILGGMAITYATGGEPEIAEVQFLEAAEMLEELVRDFPSVPEYRFRAAHAVRRSAVHSVNTDRLGEAVGRFKKAFDIMEELVDEHGSIIRYRMDLAELAFLIGQIGRRNDPEAETGLDWMEKALAIGDALVSEVPDEPRIRHKTAKYYREMATINRLSEKFEEAHNWLEQSIAMRRQLVEEAPDFEEYRRHLAIDLNELSQLFEDEERYADSVPPVRESVRIRTENAELFPGRLDHVAEACTSYIQLGDVLRMQGESTPAIEAYEDAFEIADQSAGEHLNDPRFRHIRIWALELLVESHLENRDREQAELAFNQAIGFYEIELIRENQNSRVIETGESIKELWADATGDEESERGGSESNEPVAEQAGGGD